MGESDPNGALIKEIINKGEQYATHAKIGGYDAITFIPPIETKKYYPALTILLDKADEEKMVIRSVMSEWKSESSDLTTTDYTIDKDHDGEPECRLVIASERDIPIVLRQELIDNPLGYLTTRVKELNARNDKGSLIAKARVANTYFTHKNDAGEEIEWEFQLDNTFRLVTTDEKSTNERRVNHLKSEDFTGAIN